MISSKKFVLPALLLVTSLVAPVRAVVLAEFTVAGGNGGAGFAKGQSFTVAGSGAYTDIVFNFFLDGRPIAGGTGFLLSSGYAGTPANLSNLTPGFRGSALGAGGFYNFGSAVTLAAGMQYFLYSNTAFEVTGDGAGGYPGGALYDNGGTGGTFLVFPGQDWNFRVTGNAVAAIATPEGGAALGLLGCGLVLLAAGRRWHQPSVG